MHKSIATAELGLHSYRTATKIIVDETTTQNFLRFSFLFLSNLDLQVIIEVLLVTMNSYERQQRSFQLNFDVDSFFSVNFFQL